MKNRQVMIEEREQQIIDFIEETSGCPSKDMFGKLNSGVSYVILERRLPQLVEKRCIASTGQRKGSKYIRSPVFSPIHPLDIDACCEKDIDQRNIQDHFNFSII